MSSTTVRGVRAKSRVGFWFNVQKQSVPEPGGTSFPKKPPLDRKSEGHQGGRKSMGGALISITDLHPYLLCRLVPFLTSWISKEALPLIGLCLIWCRVIIFSLGVTLHYSVISNSLT